MDHLCFFDRVNESKVGHRAPMEQLDEYVVLVVEARGNEGSLLVDDRLSAIVNSADLVAVEFFNDKSRIGEDQDPQVSIVIVGNAEVLRLGEALLDFFRNDVVARDRQQEFFFLVEQAEPFDHELGLVLVTGHHHRQFGVVSDHAVHHVEVRHYILSIN